MKPNAVAFITQNMKTIKWVNPQAAKLFAIKPVGEQDIENVKAHTQIKANLKNMKNNDTKIIFIKEQNTAHAKSIKFEIEKTKIKNEKGFIITSQRLKHKATKVKQLSENIVDVFEKYGTAIIILDEKNKTIAKTKNIKQNEIDEINKDKITEKPKKMSVKINGTKKYIYATQIENEEEIIKIIIIPEYQTNKNIKEKYEITKEKKINLIIKNKNENVGTFTSKYQNLGENKLGRWYYRNKIIEKPKLKEKYEMEQPMRFVWEMDEEFVFTRVSAELAEALGEQNADIHGRKWEEIREKLGIAENNEITKALEKKDTWSGKTIMWPLITQIIGNKIVKVPIDFAGLPDYGKNKKFSGFKGFGIIRIADAIEEEIQEDVKQKIIEQQKQEKKQKTEKIIQKNLSKEDKEIFEEIGKKLGKQIENENIQKIYESTPVPAAFASLKKNRGKKTSVDTSILEQLNMPVVVHRGNEILFANSEFLNVVGYENLEEIKNDGGIEKLFAGQLIAGQLVATQNKMEVEKIIHKDGKIIEVEAKTQYVPWDENQAMLLTLQYEQEKKKNNESEFDNLQKEELKSVLDTSADGIVIVDRHGEIQALNYSAQVMFEVGEKESIGGKFIELFEEKNREIVQQYQEIIQNDGVRESVEIVGETNEGEEINLSMTMGKLQNSQSYCAIVRDMTLTKITQEQLVNAKKKAEEADREKSELLARVSHEMRTPLNAIIGFSEMMEKNKKKEYAKDIHKAGEHMLDLVNDLLDVAKAEDIGEKIKLTPCDLNVIVSEVVQMNQPHAQKNNVIIRTMPETKLPKIIADKKSVVQMIMNIINNSIKFIEQNGQIIISTSINENNKVKLKIKDNGIGMSKTEIEMALKPFQQIEKIENNNIGTGLGLAITKMLVDANNANININSKPKEGTLVEIEFPAHKTK